MSYLRRPIVTEKLTKAGEMKQRQYGFIVEMDANKIQIKNEIEKTYNVKVESVRTLIIIGKTRNRSTRSRYITGHSSNYKKAFVTLASGQEIDFYKNI